MTKDELIAVEHLIERINRMIQVDYSFIRLKFVVKLSIGSEKPPGKNFYRC
jgi:hypothetical protein